MRDNGSIESIPHYLQLSGYLHTAGQPTPDQLEHLGTSVIRNVINLALPTSDNSVLNEGALLTAQGIRYFHIPIDWENPREEDFTLFRRLLPIIESEPLLIHCALNMRVSAFVYLYRRLMLNFDHPAAAPDLLKIWTPTDQWYLFINKILRLEGLAEVDW